MTADTDPNGPLACLARVRAVLRHPGLTDRERVVLAELASHDQSRFVPTVDVLAQSLYAGPDERRNRDFCRRVLRSLEAKDVLSVEYREGRVVRYAIKVDDTEQVSDSTPHTLTPAECQVTPSECQSDTGSVALRDKKNKKKEKRASDTERVSPKLKKGSGYLGKTKSWQRRQSRKIKQKKNIGKKNKLILGLLEKTPNGLRGWEIAEGIGLNGSPLEVADNLKELLEGGFIHQASGHNSDLYLFGKEKAA